MIRARSCIKLRETGSRRFLAKEMNCNSSESVSGSRGKRAHRIVNGLPFRAWVFNFSFPLIILWKVLVDILRSLHIKLHFSPHSALQITFNLSSRGRYRRLTAGVKHFVIRLRFEIILCTRGILTSISSAVSSIVDHVCAFLSTFNFSIRDMLLIESLTFRLDVSIIRTFRYRTPVKIELVRTPCWLHIVFMFTVTVSY